jgi:hypothetical protein
MNAPVSNSARKLNGGQALAEMLKASGVGPMFGMGGFQLLPFYEAMRALGLRHFLINDERCGAFASDAYARVSGRARPIWSPRWWSRSTPASRKSRSSAMPTAITPGKT